MDGDTVSLLWLLLAAVTLLILMIAWLRLNAFLALLFAALFVGLGSGMPAVKVMSAFQDGMGATLGGIAGVLGLGTMLGGLLAVSGGAEVLATRLVRFFGPERMHLCLMCLALAVGLTTWFAVGLIMLLPILLTLARETKMPFLKLAIPLLACLSIMHGVMPPHPGPLVALDALNARLGVVMLWGAVVAVPVAAVSGPIFARWAVKHVPVEAPPPPAYMTAGAKPAPVGGEAGDVKGEEGTAESGVTGGSGGTTAPGRPRPSFGRTVAALAVPVLLLLSHTAAELWLPKGHAVRDVTAVIGNPTLALGLGVLFSAWAFGFTRVEALKAAESSLAPIAMTLLLVGAGGGFNRVLRDCGAADAIGKMAGAANLPPLVFGWLCAALVRVATGSATVAITAASGLVAVMAANSPGTNPELLVVAIGCGSLFLSHLNDSGFWIVKETLGLTVGQTLRTWTVTESLVGVTGLIVCYLLDLVF